MYTWCNLAQRELEKFCMCTPTDGCGPDLTLNLELKVDSTHHAEEHVVQIIKLYHIYDYTKLTDADETT